MHTLTSSKAYNSTSSINSEESEAVYLMRDNSDATLPSSKKKNRKV